MVLRKVGDTISLDGATNQTTAIFLPLNINLYRLRSIPYCTLHGDMSEMCHLKFPHWDCRGLATLKISYSFSNVIVTIGGGGGSNTAAGASTAGADGAGASSTAGAYGAGAGGVSSNTASAASTAGVDGGASTVGGAE